MNELIRLFDQEPTQMDLALPNPMAVTVSPPRIREGDRIERDGIRYECRGKVPGGKRFVRLDTGIEVLLGNVSLVGEMVARRIRILAPEFMNPARTKRWHLEFQARSETERRLAYMRLAYVKAFERNRDLGYPLKVREALDEVHRLRMADEANIVADERKPSLAAVYEWQALWDKADPSLRGVKLLCFAESQRGPTEPRLDTAVVPIVRDALRDLWFTARRTRTRAVWDRVYTVASSEGVPPDRIPCLRSVRRLIANLSPYAVAKARLGTRGADRLRSVGQLREAAFPGEVYEVDAHKLDCEQVDPKGWPIGRLWMTSVIDRHSRMIVGFHLHVEPPCSLTVAAALRNALAPKLYMRERWPEIGRDWLAWGKPIHVILDNGLENHAKFLIEAFEELGILWHFAAPMTPEEKAYIERFFGTFTRDFTSRLPGWTGSDPKARGDYDSRGMARLTLEQVDELIHRWITAYNLTFHTGVKAIPEQRWVERVGGTGGEPLEVAPIDDLGMLDVLLGEYAERTPTRDGISMMGLRYGDKGDVRPLEALRTRPGAAALGKVRIRFDRSDLSMIRVEDPVTREYFGVPSLDPDYTTDMTLARHRIICARAREVARGYIKIGDLCRIRDDLQRRIDEMTGAEPMTERRFAALYNGIGSKGSWAEFYRLAKEEYGKGPEDKRSIVDLLETEDGWILPPVPPTDEVAPEHAAPATMEPAPVAEGKRTRAAKAGVAIAEAAPPEPEPADELDAAPDTGDTLADRENALGVRFD